MELVNFPQWGVGDPSEGSTSVFRSIVESKVQSAVPVLSFIKERIDLNPNFSYPIGSERLCAILSKSSPLVSRDQNDTLNAKSQGMFWIILIAIGVMLYLACEYVQLRPVNKATVISLNNHRH